MYFRNSFCPFSRVYFISFSKLWGCGNSHYYSKSGLIKIWVVILDCHDNLFFAQLVVSIGWYWLALVGREPSIGRHRSALVGREPSIGRHWSALVGFGRLWSASSPGGGPLKYWFLGFWIFTIFTFPWHSNYNQVCVELNKTEKKI